MRSKQVGRLRALRRRRGIGARRRGRYVRLAACSQGITTARKTESTNGVTAVSSELRDQLREMVASEIDFDAAGGFFRQLKEKGSSREDAMAASLGGVP